MRLYSGLSSHFIKDAVHNQIAEKLKDAFVRYIASNLRHLKFKQLNFVQHVKTLLKINGRAGIVASRQRAV